MRVDKVVYNLLNTDSNITDIVNNRIYPVVAPQNTTSDFIVYHVTDLEQADTKTTKNSYAKFRVQINSYTTRYNVGQDLQEKIKLRLNRQSGTIAGQNLSLITFDSFQTLDFEYELNKYSMLSIFNITLKT